MNKLWIYGDSFSDETYTFTDHKNWYDFFQNRVNKSKKGIGASHLLKTFINDLSNNKDDLNLIDLIVFLPDPYRLDLIYLPEPQCSANAKNIFDFFESGKNMNELFDFISSNKEFYIDKTDKICENYYNFYELGLNDLLPIFVITTILYYCHNFRSVLIWPTNDVYFDNHTSKKIGTDYGFLTKNYGKFDNLYIIEKSLNQISYSELESFDYFKEYRNNHLSEQSHLLVYDTINQWITENNKII